VTIDGQEAIDPIAKGPRAASARTGDRREELFAAPGLRTGRLGPQEYRYRSRRENDTALRRRLRELASERRRLGYRRLLVLLRREGFEVNHKRLFPLVREERLTVRTRGGRKRALDTRAPLDPPVRPNERWSLDFASDVRTDGRRVRVLVVMDDLSRKRPARPLLRGWP